MLAEKKLTFTLREERVWEQRPEYLELNPAATVPTLVEENGFAIPDSAVICEYLEEAYQDSTLLGHTHEQRVEVRRLAAWFDGKFDAEVTRNLNGQKYFRRLAGRGHPDAGLLRIGYTELREHLEYIGWLALTRKYLAGPILSLADLAAAAHLSVLDYAGDVDWKISLPAREWYARIKARPSFAALLNDRVPGMVPPPHYADLEF